MNDRIENHRRRFLKTTAAAFGVATLPRWAQAQSAPAVITDPSARPVAAQGLQFGDSRAGSAIVWSRSDRPARLIVEYALDEQFADARKVIGPHALKSTDYTVRQELVGLPPGRDVFVRASFQGLDNSRALSEPVLGRLRTPSLSARDIRFVWGGDTAGQGWGINPAFGGMRIYEAMRKRRPHFFI
ncbi:PhoD-like phosphatase N-terminal domain-containing protein, partial [Methylibium sp.]|uniref:PhoD-like phosphatase N-terminal domain-containing protein n=1 Tax=Methylibium sp. TaxID=2067992 RepID=UPI0017982DB7